MSTSKRFGRLAQPIFRGVSYGGVDRRLLQKTRALKRRLQASIRTPKKKIIGENSQASLLPADDRAA
jgi:hypothetical protein